MQADAGAGDGPGPWTTGSRCWSTGRVPPQIGAIPGAARLPPAEAVGERAKAGFSVRARPGAGRAARGAGRTAAAGQDGPAFLVAGGPDPPADRTRLVQLEAAMPAARTAAGGGCPPRYCRSSCSRRCGASRKTSRACGCAPRRGPGYRAGRRAPGVPRSSATRCAPRTCTRSQRAGATAPQSTRSAPSEDRAGPAILRRALDPAAHAQLSAAQLSRRPTGRLSQGGCPAHVQAERAARHRHKSREVDRDFRAARNPL